VPARQWLLGYGVCSSGRVVRCVAGDTSQVAGDRQQHADSLDSVTCNLHPVPCIASQKHTARELAMMSSISNCTTQELWCIMDGRAGYPALVWCCAAPAISRLSPAGGRG